MSDKATMVLWLLGLLVVTLVVPPVGGAALAIWVLIALQR